MQKISLKRLLTFGFSTVFIVVSIVAVTLWYSTYKTTAAIENLKKYVEMMGSVQLIQEDLSIHRRQALLKGIRSDAERKVKTDQAKEELIEVSSRLDKFVTNSEDFIKVKTIKDHILVYINAYETHRNQGIQAEKLYESVSDQFNQAEDDIQNLMRFNLSQATSLQAQTTSQNLINYSLVFSTFFVLVISFAILLFALKKNFYAPLVVLKSTIDRFQLGEKIENSISKGAFEVASISNSFIDLSGKLKKQKEQQLTFLSAIAHDLKNPLGAIKMSADLIADNSDLSTSDLEILSIISRQTNHLERLINDLLDTTRIESGNMQMQFRKINLVDVIEDTSQLHQSFSKKHRFSFQIPNNQVLVFADKDRITQVFNNLYSNAIKYSPEGGTISTLLFVSDDHVTVEISDTGVGIASSETESIFEPFRRASNTINTIPGIGLGLSACRKIIRAHTGGEIIALPKSEGGTTFVVKINIAKELKTQNQLELH